MKGILITLCSVSQIGKEYIAENLKKEIELQSGGEVVYPTVYKTRGSRVSDPENLICVERESEIPKEFSLRYLVRGEQVVAYSENEIARALQNGKVVVLTCGSVATVQKLKSDFGDKCISVKVANDNNESKHIAGYNQSPLDNYQADYNIFNCWSTNNRTTSGSSLLVQIRDLVGQIATRIEEKNPIEQ